MRLQSDWMNLVRVGIEFFFFSVQKVIIAATSISVAYRPGARTVRLARLTEDTESSLPADFLLYTCTHSLLLAEVSNEFFTTYIAVPIKEI